jgi:hypothetical protein
MYINTHAYVLQLSSQGHAQLGDSEEIENEYRNIGELHI